jgi:hypothetical protein
MDKLAFALAFSIATVAHAAPRASAVELFAHGRALAAEGKCAEAVPFFLDTLKLEASVGALLNLAECHEKLHDDAQAYARFREAESLARDKGDDREALARTRADDLGKHVPRVVVTAPADVHVTLDGHDARVGENVVTEGDHVVRATAEGKTPWEATVRAAAGRGERVVVPELQPRAIIVEPLKAKPTDAQRTIGIVMTFFGAAGVATGSVLGAVAIVKKNDELAASSGPSQTAFDDAKASAHAFGDASTVAFIAGGVLAVAGLVVWLTAPRAPVTVGARALTITF